MLPQITLQSLFEVLLICDRSGDRNSSEEKLEWSNHFGLSALCSFFVWSDECVFTEKLKLR